MSTITTKACDAIGEELVAYVDGELGEAERTRIEAHTASCLTCRREMDRIAKMDVLLTALPRLEPSAGFEATMWQRLEGEVATRSRRRGFRPAMWGVPLAAAAVLALVSYSSLQSNTPVVPRGARDVASAPKPAGVHHASAEEHAIAQAPAAAVERAEQPVAHAKAELAPEDVPPELIEHPELFLRLPVVRRLDKLEHFEEVRTPHEDAEPVGAIDAGDALG